MPFGHKLVTCAVQRQEVTRSAGIWFELLSEPEDVIVNGARGRIVIVSPNFVQEFLSRENFAG
jgi:hypothetical protein